MLLICCSTQLLKRTQVLTINGTNFEKHPETIQWSVQRHFFYKGVVSCFTYNPPGPSGGSPSEQVSTYIFTLIFKFYIGSNYVSFNSSCI